MCILVPVFFKGVGVKYKQTNKHYSHTPILGIPLRCLHRKSP